MRRLVLAGPVITACYVPITNFAGTDGPFGDGPPATSCIGLSSTCGPGSDSCCESPLVIGGDYARSYDEAGDGMFPDSSFGATVSTFRLDKYEVTVGRFRQFVAAGQGTEASPPVAGIGAHPNIPNSGWDASWNPSLQSTTDALVAAVNCITHQTWTDTPGDNENLPMGCITWYEAMAFCVWDGGFLPTEAEWNYAAAGGSEQRVYPSSSPAGFLGIDCSYANYHPTDYCVNPPTGAQSSVGSESPKGDGKWGQSDLSGNVSEWTLDWYASPYPQNPCPDCANLTRTPYRVQRGGTLAGYPADLRAALRVAHQPFYRFGGIGVRCARTP